MVKSKQKSGKSSALPNEEDNFSATPSQLLPTEPMTAPVPQSLQPLTRKLFVASLGNPAPYFNTLHSAGHHVLRALQSDLSYPPFQLSRAHASAQVSQGGDALLWQSPSLMNVSGVALSKAWRFFLSGLADEETQQRARLVILHDELELELGRVKTRKPGSSLKGHNGLKSAVANNAGGSGGQFWRIGIGIGRPASRESEDISQHVLRKMTERERETIDGAASAVTDELIKIRDS